MDLLICIDDTDNAESQGTGHLAAELAERLQGQRWGAAGPITRHQLLVHPDIPYTSHNSSMCFPFKTGGAGSGSLDEVIACAGRLLSERSAPGSDPGLCVADRETLTADAIKALIAFGNSAKTTVLRQDHAHGLARRLGVHLSGHGGTGGGVIGALAGAGLRLSGNDGRFRGHFQLGDQGFACSVAEIKRRTHVEIVRGLDGPSLSDADLIVLGPRVKAVLLDNLSTLLVYRREQNTPDNTPSRWHTCDKEQLRRY
jgi:hypothetical protein